MAGRRRSLVVSSWSCLKTIFLVVNFIAGIFVVQQVITHTRVEWVDGPLPSDRALGAGLSAQLLRGNSSAKAKAPRGPVKKKTRSTSSAPAKAQRPRDTAGKNHTGLVMDGVEVKELPQFWKPAPGVDPDALRSEVEGQPTIFVSIASYRDPLCHVTLAEALKWADHPRRLVFGVVEQNALDDEPDLRCDYTPKPCSEEPSQSLCRHQSQLRLLRVDAAKARGPCFGRHRADRLYRGEHFVMQVDAHSFFVKGWDTKIIGQWRTTKNEYAVLSTYPSDYRYFDSAKGEKPASSPHTVPVMCRANFVEDGMVRPDAAGEVTPTTVGKTPILETIWGAGTSFSRGHRILRVPYDCCLDMMFAGEEFSMTVRMWTHGYDFYAPNPTVAYHWYERPKRPRLFWENTNAAPHAAARSARRVLAMLGDPPAHGEYDASDIGPGDRYGLGKRRPLQIFLRLFGFNITKRRARNNCKWVLPQTMHQELTPYLRADRKGIDYSRVPVKELLDRHFPNRDKPRQCAYSSVQEGFLPGCCQSCQGYPTLEEAKNECSQEEKCSGVTSISSKRFELRRGKKVVASPSGERTYVRGKCED